MRVRTNLRLIRGGRELKDAADATGLHAGDLSRIERGHLIPTETQATRMELFYGPRAGWYPATVAHALRPDDGNCRACNSELEPDALGSRRYCAECRA